MGLESEVRKFIKEHDPGLRVDHVKFSACDSCKAQDVGYQQPGCAVSFGRRALNSDSLLMLTIEGLDEGFTVDADVGVDEEGTHVTLYCQNHASEDRDVSGGEVIASSREIRPDFGGRFIYDLWGRVRSLREQT